MSIATNDPENFNPDFLDVASVIEEVYLNPKELLRRQRLALTQVISVKNQTTDFQERRSLSFLIQQMADELGVHYVYSPEER